MLHYHGCTLLKAVLAPTMHYAIQVNFHKVEFFNEFMRFGWFPVG